jgi:hypothetical protein
MAIVGNEMKFTGTVRLGSGYDTKTIPYEFRAFETYDTSKLTSMIKKAVGVPDDTTEFKILTNRSQIINSDNSEYDDILDIKKAAKVIKADEVVKDGDTSAKKTKVQTPTSVARMPRMDVEHQQPDVTGESVKSSTPIKSETQVVKETPKQEVKKTGPEKSRKSRTKRDTRQKNRGRDNTQKQTSSRNTAPAKKTQRNKAPVKKRGLLERVMGNKK